MLSLRCLPATWPPHSSSVRVGIRICSGKEVSSGPEKNLCDTLWSSRREQSLGAGPGSPLTCPGFCSVSLQALPQSPGAVDLQVFSAGATPIIHARLLEDPILGATHPSGSIRCRALGLVPRYCHRVSFYLGCSYRSWRERGRGRCCHLAVGPGISCSNRWRSHQADFGRNDITGLGRCQVRKCLPLKLRT